MDDTSPHIKKLLHERYMSLSGEERLMMGMEMFEAARALVLASFPKDLSEQEVRKRLCERFYGKKLADKVYGA